MFGYLKHWWSCTCLQCLPTGSTHELAPIQISSCSVCGLCGLSFATSGSRWEIKWRASTHKTQFAAGEIRLADRKPNPLSWRLGLAHCRVSAMRIGSPEPKTRPPTTTSRLPTVTRCWFGRIHLNQRVSKKSSFHEGSIHRAPTPPSLECTLLQTRRFSPHGVGFPPLRAVCQPTDRREPWCGLVSKRRTPSKYANKSPPSCRCERTSARASWIATLNKRVSLFSSFILPNPMPLPLAVLPCVSRRLGVRFPHERQQLLEPRHGFDKHDCSHQYRHWRELSCQAASL